MPKKTEEDPQFFALKDKLNSWHAADPDTRFCWGGIEVLQDKQETEDIRRDLSMLWRPE